MRFLELKESTDSETHDEFANNIDKYKTTDTRRPRLTLKHLNKLRKIREMKKADEEKRGKILSVIYQRPPAQ